MENTLSTESWSVLLWNLGEELNKLQSANDEGRMVPRYIGRTPHSPTSNISCRSHSTGTKIENWHLVHYVNMF
jgi:hypothetical protein